MWDECSVISIDPGASWSKATCAEAYENCKTNGQLFSDDNCKNKVAGGAEPCGKYCQWGTACWEIKTNPKATTDNPTVTTTCDEAIANCESNGDGMFSSSTVTGAGTTCDGPKIGGDPSVGYCRWWPNPSSSDADEKVGSCWPVKEADRAGCIADGSLYALDVPTSGQGVGKQCEGGTWVSGRNPSTVVYCDYGAASEYGDGGCVVETDAATCTGNYGTPYSDANCTVAIPGNSVKLLNNKAAGTSAIRVSYAKSGLTVNWTSAAKISGGTVDLINAKGVVMASSLVKANSVKVTAKLGTKGVPAGMYFVRISVRDVGGKKVVMQSPVSVVK